MVFIKTCLDSSDNEEMNCFANDRGGQTYSQQLVVTETLPNGEKNLEGFTDKIIFPEFSGIVVAQRRCDLAILKRTPNVDPRFEGSVKFYTGDRNRPADLKAAIEDFRPDTVVDFVCFDPLQADQLSDLVPDKLQHYVFVSTVDVYGYPLSRIPMRENDTLTQTQAPYGANKRSCEELLVGKQETAGLPLTIVRPTYSFGVQSGMLSFFTWDGMKFQVPRIRAGLPVLVPGLSYDDLDVCRRPLGQRHQAAFPGQIRGSGLI